MKSKRAYIFKRIFSLILVFSLVLTFVPSVVLTAKAEEAQTFNEVENIDYSAQSNSLLASQDEGSNNIYNSELNSEQEESTITDQNNNSANSNSIDSQENDEKIDANNDSNDNRSEEFNVFQNVGSDSDVNGSAEEVETDSDQNNSDTTEQDDEPTAYLEDTVIKSGNYISEISLHTTSTSGIAVPSSVFNFQSGTTNYDVYYTDANVGTLAWRFTLSDTENMFCRFLIDGKTYSGYYGSADRKLDANSGLVDNVLTIGMGDLTSGLSFEKPYTLSVFIGKKYDSNNDGNITYQDDFESYDNYDFTVRAVPGFKAFKVTDENGSELALNPTFNKNNSAYTNDYYAATTGETITFKTINFGFNDGVKLYIGNDVYTKKVTNLSVNLASYISDGSNVAKIPLTLAYENGDISNSRTISLWVTKTSYAPEIKNTLEDITCDKNAEASLQVIVSDQENSSLSYQWRSGTTEKNLVAIEGATESKFVVPTDRAGTKYYDCIVTNTIDGQTYSTNSNIAKVQVNLTSVNAPIILRQPGTYSMSGQNEYSSDYLTEYTAGTKFDPIYVQMDEPEAGTSYTFEFFYKTNIEDSTSTATPISGKTKKYTSDDRCLDYVFTPSESLPIGDNYVYCVVTATGDNSMSNSVTSQAVKLTYRALNILLEGSGTSTSPYKIQSTDDLVAMKALNDKGFTFEGLYFAVCNDITLPSDWKPIGTSDARFGGILDGNFDGDKQCATITVPEGGLPLLGYVKEAEVRNLNIRGTKIAGAGLVNNFNGVNFSGSAILIENVTLKSGSSTLKSGFVASSGGNGFAYASVGFNVTIRNCRIEDNVTIGYGKDQSYIGSFAGRINCTIENCTSEADVYGKSYVGGILGTVDNALGQCVVKNCTFAGTVTATANCAGGIVGGGYGNATAPNGIRPTIQACTVTGGVTGDKYVGGIFGGDLYVAQTWDNVVSSISANSFTGTVSGNQCVGAIIGYLNSLNRYDSISGNTYSADCGADKGIGFVKYLDTNYKNPATMNGTIVFNTENGTSGCPTVEGCAWKANHNRTDDPLGADADKLCKKLGSSEPVKPTCYEIKVSGSYKTEYTVGDELDLSGIKITAYWTDKTTTELTTKDVKVTGYDKDKTGNQTVTISYGELKDYITVTVKPKSTAITVTVSILGDSKHGETSKPHGLAQGGLKSWYSGTVEANANETVWDVLKRVASANGISISADSSNSYGTVYIRSVNGLGEFDNGSNSGWMYTVNGTHPEVGVSAKYVKNGDKIILHYTDDYSYEEGGVNYGKDPGTSTDTTAKEVDALIEKIGTVSYTDACKQRIDAARKAYNNLSATDKTKVTKLSVLEAAEKKYNELKKADDQEKANAVIGLINKIDKTITKDSKKSIEAARTAYDKLTAEQKALVTNYKKLTDAETALAKLTASDKDKEKAQEVIDLIDKLGTITLKSEKDIEAARAAYDKLTDMQKLLVENYDVLEQAEAKLAALKGSSKIDDPYKITGDYLENLGTPGVGSIGGEWMVIGLLRSDRKVDEAYYEAVVKCVQENIDENGRLHAAKSTENSRIILALTAMGKDVTKVGGYNLLTGLGDMDFVQKQGINGPIWALIALDSGNYPVPDGNVTREGLIQAILLAQTSDGGWAISGDEADSDMTGMALQALAPYYETNEEVKNAVDKALVTLSEMQDADGGFSTFSGNGKVATSESTAQVIVALTALGINPDTDARFIKNGHSAIDALLSYYVQGGGFKHIASGELDGMATEQGYYALTAYYRFLYGKTSLYNMTDVIDKGGVVAVTPEEPDESTEPDVPAVTEPDEVEKEDASFPWVIMVLVLLIGFGGGVLTVAVIIPKVKKKNGRYE